MIIRFIQKQFIIFDTFLDRALYSDFKAFRFPSTPIVNFIATVQFCQELCEPVSSVICRNLRQLLKRNFSKYFILLFIFVAFK